MAVINQNGYHTPDDVRAGGGNYRGVSGISQAATVVASPTVEDAAHPRSELATSHSTRKTPGSPPSPAELPGSPTVGQAREAEGQKANYGYKPYRPSGLGLTQ